MSLLPNSVFLQTFAVLQVSLLEFPAPVIEKLIRIKYCKKVHPRTATITAMKGLVSKNDSSE